MDNLRDRIDSIRLENTNADNHHFVPEDALFQVLSASAINLALRSLKISLHELPELERGIMHGARKCFAILILMGKGEAITNFFRRDLLQPSRPDDRLPYVAEVLGSIFEEQANSLTVKRFIEKQWEFTMPILHQRMISRQLDKDVVLPIMRKEDAGRGAMGTAFKLELHPQYHRLPLDGHKVINKQIQYRQGENKKVFEREVENLALLTFLKHPNIVQLYCSYMYRDTYNLIFAVADGGSLDNFLKQDQDATGLTGTQLLLALAGLADAINSTHNFTSEAIDISLSGCHHDLAPRNILLHSGTLLLADFGLSTFRNVDEDSLTMFKEVRGSYVAPECQDIDNGQVQSGQVSRASDIWSFGCILMEVLIHMMQGPAGVEHFRNGRNSQVTPEIDWFRFHRGRGEPNPEVNSWLDRLQMTGPPFSLRLVDLIREMLSMDPSERPRSKRVLELLRGIAILSLADAVKASLGGTSRADPGTERTLGHLRFETWLVAFKQLLDDVTNDSQSDVDFAFPVVVEALQEILRILENREERIDGVRHQQPSLLRYQQQRLREALPPQYRSVARDHLTKQVLRDCDPEDIGSLSSAMLDTSMDHDVGNLIAVRHLTNLAEAGRLGEDGSDGDLILDQRHVSLRERLDIHSFAVLE